MINIATKVTLNSKTSKIINDLIKEISMSSYQSYTSQAKPSKLIHIYDVNAITVLAIYMETLSKMIDGLLVML